MDWQARQTFLLLNWPSKAPSLFHDGHFYGFFIFCFNDRSAIVTAFGAHHLATVKSFGAQQSVLIPASVGNHCNLMQVCDGHERALVPFVGNKRLKQVLTKEEEFLRLL